MYRATDYKGEYYSDYSDYSDEYSDSDDEVGLGVLRCGRRGGPFSAAM